MKTFPNQSLETAGQKLLVCAPLCGWCASLDDNPDPVFRGKILGDGVSLDPTAGELRAPFDAEVLSIPDSLHAINLRASNGAEFLIHIGIDTVRMGGNGFEAHVSVGDHVSAGQKLISFDLELVLRQASSLKTPFLLLETDQFEINQVRTDGPVGFGDILFEVSVVASDTASGKSNRKTGADDSPAESGKDPGSELSRTVITGLEHGIHARPAAALIESLKNFQANVYCQSGNTPRANARSAVALMSLGVSYGDTVTVIATGADAGEALDTMVGLLEPLAGTPQNPASASTSGGVPRKSVSNTANADHAGPGLAASKPPANGSVIRAQAASPGLAIGKAFHLDSTDIQTNLTAGSAEEEQTKLHDAIGKVRKHLQKLANDDQGTRSEIAAAHLALVDDPMISDAAGQQLADGAAAATAWQHGVEQAISTLRTLKDQRMLERVDDLHDINLRVQRVLAGQDPASGLSAPAGSIVLADNMLPSQILELDRESVNGICLAAGGATSHVAILAMSLKIPMLVAAGNQVLAIEDGSELLVDADLSELLVKPDSATSEAFQARMVEDQIRQLTEAESARDACLTSDGERIHVLANLASPKDAATATESGAEGCGLLRTEFIFMEKPAAPDEQAQLETYQQISDSLGEYPLVVRTLDAGGDKPISYIDQPFEENPALGVRGIRLSLLREDLLRAQLTALLNVRRSTPLKVMIPMVSSVREVQAVRDLLEDLSSAIPDAASIDLGIMIETPAAALIADKLAPLVDFFSIGTNDLTQYTLSMDRGEPRLAAQLDTLHPAVLSLIKQTVTAAEKAGIPVAVCGGAAGDMLAAPLLIGLGVRELSMPQSLIARQKARLRSVSIEQCTNLADKALDMSAADEVRAMMRHFLTA